jgi:hypothetical protein
MSEGNFNKRDYHCFISYASEDSVVATRIASWLSQAGLEVWIDKLRLSAGTRRVDPADTKFSRLSVGADPESA